MLNKNKFEKVLKRILDKNFERCSICRKPFLDRAILLLVWIRTIKFRT